MALFSKERDEARAERDAAISERDEAVKALEELRGQLSTKEFEVNFLTSQNQQFDTALAGANARITALETEKLKAEADLTQFKADFETKLNAAVIERCAAAGLETPVAKDKVTEHGGSLAEQVDAIKDPAERTAFIQKNHRALIAEARAK